MANNISLFLEKFHGFDPVMGAKVVQNFWGAFTFGCLLGIAALKLDPIAVCVGFAIAQAGYLMGSRARTTDTDSGTGKQDKNSEADYP